MALVGLFAGVGGLELGFASAGLHASLLAEIDPFAAVVLKSRFPDARLVGDVTTLADLPADTAIVAAGFPCQNLSMAGDKRGIDGTKSGIVSELFRLIASSRAPTIVIENVYFMLHLDGGRAMDQLAKRFEEMKYRWAYRVLDTMGFGLPQRRRRVYFIASRDLDPRDVLFADETESQKAPKPNLDVPLGFYWTEGRTGVGITANGIPPLKGGSGVGIPSAPAVLFPDGAVLMPSLEACERLQGFPPSWTSPVKILGGRPPGWRLLGNAVSVPVASWVASRLVSPGQRLQLATRTLSNGERWPDAAFNVDGVRKKVSATDRPILNATPSIAAFRDDSWLLLSDRALNGFVGRALKGSLRFPEGFIDALRRAKRRAPREARKVYLGESGYLTS